MTEATGMMAFWLDIEADYRMEFCRWHNCEHITERVGIPGFLGGRRYRGNGDAATFLVTYETETPGVLASDAYLARLNDPTPWTREALAQFRNPARNIYRLIDAAGDKPAVAAPYLATIRFNLAGDDYTVIARYRDKVLPALAAGADVARARLWQIDPEVSGMETAERRIYGGGPGEQRYLLLVELLTELSPYRPDTLPGLDAAQADLHRDIFTEVGWLDFALDDWTAA